MAFTEVEGFNVANGTVLTATNCPGITGTTLTGTGAATSDSSWTKEGASSAKFAVSDGTSTAMFYRDITAGAIRAWRFYGKIPATLPTSNTAICIVKSTHSGTMITQMYLDGSGDAVPGSIKVQDSGSLIIGAKTASLTGSVFRADVICNATAGSVTWRLFVGANVDGTTPDYTWTKASGNGATNPGSILCGVTTVSGSAMSINIDTLAEATDGTVPGPFVATTTVIRPLTDITTTGWTKTAGAATYSAAVNETTTDDTSYDESPANPTASPLELKLAAGSFPGSTLGHTVTVRMTQVSATSTSVVCALMQGATTISTHTFTGLTTSYVDYTWTLTSTEAGNITDYTDLRIRVTATAS